jgi:hypothetical protein
MLCPFCSLFAQAQSTTPKIEASTFVSVELDQSRIGTILEEGPTPQTQILTQGASLFSRGPREASRAIGNRGPFLVLSAGVYGFAMLDMHETVSVGGYEDNPLARPFVKLPRPAYYATGMALATSVNWMASKMKQSKRWRKIWWLPQACSIAANLWGYTSTRAQE